MVGWKPLCLSLLLLVVLSTQPTDGKRSFKRLKQKLRTIFFLTPAFEPKSPFSCLPGDFVYRDRCFKLINKKQSYEKAASSLKREGAHIAKFESILDVIAFMRAFRSTSKVKSFFVGIKFSSYQARFSYQRMFKVKFKYNKCLILKKRKGTWRFGLKSCASRMAFVGEYKGCRKDEFRCGDGKKCVKNSLKCNGLRECDDGSDEELPECTSCGGKLSKDSGVIQSPNYPNSYKGNSNCKWQIDVANADYIKITFTKFDTEFWYDRLRIYYGNYVRTISGRFSTPPREAIYEVNALTIIFESDFVNQYGGFSLKFEKGDYRTAHMVTGQFQSNFRSEVFREYYSKYWVYQSASDGMSLTLQEFLFDPACTVEFFSDVDRTLLITSFAGTGNSLSYSVFSTKKYLVVSLSCGSGFTIKPKHFRLDYRVYVGFKVSLVDSKYGTLDSPPRYIETVCPYRLTGLSRDTRFVANTFDLFSGFEYILFEGRNFTVKSDFENAINGYIQNSSSVNVSISFLFVRNGTISGNGFKISFSRNCRSPVSVDYDGKPKVLTAPTGFVFDDPDLSVTSKSFVCTVGGFLSPAYVLLRKKCNIRFQTGHAFENHEVELLKETAVNEYNKEAKFDCPSPYREGTVTFKCTDKGWERDTSKCVQATCTQASVDSNLRMRFWGTSNSVLVGMKYAFGSFVVFSCSQGYERQGSRYKFCTRSGEWSSSDPSCKAMKCRVPSQYRHIFEDPDKEYDLNKLATLKCPGGKKFKNANKAHFAKCASNNLWDISFWSFVTNECVNEGCDGNPCGIHTCKALSFGYTCICKPGYFLNRRTKMCEDIDECKYSWRTWHCHTCVNTPGSYYCKCKDGYLLFNGQIPVGYTAGRAPNAWKNKMCLRKACPSVDLQHTTISRLSPYNRLFGIRTKVYCQIGYHAENLKHYYYLECLKEDGGVKWNMEDPGKQCQLGKCPSYHVVRKGVLKITSSTYGSYAEVLCAEGYTLKKNSDNKYKCRMSFRGSYAVFFWMGTAKCVRLANSKSCPDLEHPTNGRVFAVPDVGRFARYVCNQGYSLTSSPYRTCKKNGKWSGKAPACELSACPALRINGRGLRLHISGGKIKGSCLNKDFTLIGAKELVCAREDVWLSQTNLTRKSVVMCDDTYNFIGCPKGRVIQPVFSLYGYEFENPGAGCGSNNTRYPSAPCGDPVVAMRYVKKECSGKRTCWVVSSAGNLNTTRASVCGGRTPLMHLTYLCVPPNTVVSSVHSLLACDSIAPGVIRPFLKPDVNSEEFVRKFENETNICGTNAEKNLLNCMYMKARVIDRSADMLHYILIRDIIKDACLKDKKATTCAKCLDMQKKDSMTPGMPNDFCSPNVRKCFKACAKDTPLADIFERAEKQLCAASQYIGASEDNNLLLSKAFAPLMLGRESMRIYRVRSATNVWSTKTFEGNLATKTFEFSGEAVAVEVKFATSIQVTGVFVLLSGNSAFGKQISLKILTVGSSTYATTSATVTRVRGDVVKITPQVIQHIVGFRVDVSLQMFSSSEESGIRMSVSYVPQPKPKMLNCYKCEKQDSSDDCNEKDECSASDHSCVTTWSLISGKPLVSKSCSLKADAMKTIAENKCNQGGKSCSSACDSDYCNGYGRCPSWAPKCVPGLSSDSFNVTLMTVTNDTTKLKSCMSDVSKFLWEESSDLYSAFKKDSCSYSHLSYEQRLHVSNTQAFMRIIIKRQYMSHIGAACLYHEKKKHRPFEALKKEWEEKKKKTVCFGAVGFTLMSRIMHRCAEGMYFNSSDGWCVPKNMIMPDENVMVKKDVIDEVEFKLGGKEFKMDQYTRFTVTTGGIVEFKIEFRRLVLIQRLLISVVGAGYSLSRKSGEKGAMQIDTTYSLLSRKFSLSFVINGQTSQQSKPAYIFIGMRAYVGQISTVKCFSCKDEESEDKCIEDSVDCAQGLQACYTEWNKRNNRTTVSKGCRSMKTVSQMAKIKGMRSCRDESVITAENSTSPCTSYSSVSNGHSVCPVWEPACKPGLNSVHFEFEVTNKANIAKNSTCYNKTVTAIKSWIAAQIRAGAKSFFSDHGYYVTKQINMTTSNIKVEWSDDKIEFDVSVKSTYYSYKLSRLRMPSPDHPASEQPIPTVAGCPTLDIKTGTPKVITQCAFNRTVDPKTHLCHSEDDLSVNKNFAVSDGFEMEVKSGTGANATLVKGDHFKVSSGMNYSVKAKFGSKIHVTSVLVRYYGPCNFLSQSNANISGDCLSNNMYNMTPAIACVAKNATWTLTLKVDKDVTEYSFEFTLQELLLKCKNTTDSYVAVRVYFKKVTQPPAALQCAKCKKNDDCSTEVCKSNEICSAHIKKKKNVWEMEKAECKNQNACKDSRKCNSANNDCKFCCGKPNCNTFASLRPLLPVAANRRRKRRDASGSLKMSREGTFVDSKMDEKDVKSYSETNVTIFTGNDSSSTTYSWSSDPPLCKDTTPPRPTKMSACNSVTYFDEYPKHPTRRLISVAEVLPTFTDNSNEATRLEILSNGLTTNSTLNITDFEPHVVSVRAFDSSNNSYDCNVTVQWRDVTPPSVNCPDNNYVQRGDFSGENGNLVNARVTATDANGLASVRYSIKTGTSLRQGVAHKMAVTVADTKGNSYTCNYMHSLQSTKCTLYSIRLTSKEKLSVRIIVARFFTQARFTCEAGYSFGTLFVAQKTFNCDGSGVDVQSAFAGSSVIPPCSFMSAVHTLRYKLTLPQKCCSAKMDDKNVTSFLQKSVTCLSKFASSVKFASEGETCDRNLTVSYTYDNSYDSAAKLQACGLEIDAAIAKNLPTLVHGDAQCTVPSSNTTGNFTSHMSCPSGHVSNTGSVKLCVPCYKGSFYNTTSGSCVACPFDTYQDKNGKLECEKCPKDHGTLKTGAISDDSCLRACPAGFFKAGRPYGICSRCPKGTFSDMAAQNCTSCPAGKSTLKDASASNTSCVGFCAAGLYSQSGLEPCKKCPRHQYQNETGQSSCQLCPADKGTLNTGAVNVSSCVTFNPCAANPCTPGTCVVLGKFNFMCDCPKHRIGTFCGLKKDLCEAKPCNNGGNCTQTGASFNCSCPKGWMGDTCEVQDYCSLSPCKHGSTCNLTRNGGYKCESCPSQYTGKDCDLLVDPCANKPCQNDGNCTKDGQSNAFICACKKGFTGARCNKTVSPCDSVTCEHGTCNKTADSFKCNCDKGWNGTFCDEDIDECLTSPCENNGNCSNIPSSFTCECMPGFEGDNCSVNINECASNPCRNGVCKDGNNSFTCVCPENYNGTLCEDFAACPLCDKTGGTCNEQTNKCECKANFKGTYCNETVDYCNPNPCDGGVKCIQGNDLKALGGNDTSDFKCHCPKYRGGKKCDMQLDTCIGNLCKNNAPCINSTTNYTCKCPMGYKGDLCDEAYDVCVESSPCKNSGTCSPKAGGFTCACINGWVGDTCEKDFDECSVKDRCKNNGECKNGRNSFSCKCADGYSGDDCSTVLKICEGKPCKNNGKCYPVDGSPTNYTCDCTNTGFNGTNCEINIDDCPAPGANNSCKNNATCVDGIKTFSCSCSQIHFGQTCDKVRSENNDLIFGKDKVNGLHYSEFNFTFAAGSNSLSVEYWVRATSTNMDLSHFELFEEVSGGSTVTWLKNTGKSIFTKIGSKSNTATISTSSTKWSHIAVSCKPNVTEYFVDGNRVFFGPNTFIPSLENRTFKAVLGSKTDVFLGMISRVYIRNEPLSSAKVLANSKKCKLDPQTPYSDKIQLDWRVMSFGHARKKASVCGETSCPAGMTGASCNQVIDVVKPTKVYCEKSVTIVNEKTTPIDVTFKEPEFNDNVGVVRTDKTHKPGIKLPRGEYSVRYTAFDAAGNSEDCEFTLSIVPFKCESQASPDNFTIVTCSEGSQNDVYCSVVCKDPARFVIPDDGFGFYSCSPATGGWDPLIDGQFQILGCVESVPVSSSAVGSASVAITAGTTCESQVDAVKQKFLSQMVMVRKQVKSVCAKDDCTDLLPNLNLKCPGARRRKRSSTGTLTYALPGGSSSSSGMCSNIHLVPGGTCPTTAATCKPGYILNDAKTACIACNAGYYHKNAYDTTCTACPKGTYAAVQATTTKCTNCPTSETTPGVGTAASDLCYKLCPPGQYMDTASAGCKPCPVGSSNPTAGQAQCIACPPGQTAGSGSATCTKCGAGHQVAVSGLCVPCDKGQYRANDPTQLTCVDCPTSHTTAGKGATAASQCDIPICEAGHYESNKVCKPCQQGTYQPYKGRNFCTRCPRGHTSKQAATNATECKVGEVNECAVGSANCHKFATCTDTKDFFKCDCKTPNFVGNGISCTCAPNYSGDECQVKRAEPKRLSDSEIIAIAVCCTLAVIIIVSVLVTLYLKRQAAFRGKSYKETAQYDFNAEAHTNKGYQMEMQ